MNADTYLAASCAVALLGAAVAIMRKQWRLALLLGTVGPITVVVAPIAMSWMIGLDTPGVGMVWLYTMPIAVTYAISANLIAAFRFRQR